jgi:hypothetical protein
MNKCPCEIRYDAVPAYAYRPAATVKQHPAAGDEGHLVCGQSVFRAIAAVTQQAFHSPQGDNATDADKPKKRE